MDILTEALAQLATDLAAVNLSDPQQALAGFERQREAIDDGVERATARIEEIDQDLARRIEKGPDIAGAAEALKAGTDVLERVPNASALRDERQTLVLTLPELERQRLEVSQAIERRREHARRKLGFAANGLAEALRSELAEIAARLIAVYATAAAVDTATGSIEVRRIAEGLVGALDDMARLKVVPREALPVPAAVTDALEAATDGIDLGGGFIPTSVRLPYLPPRGNRAPII